MAAAGDGQEAAGLGPGPGAVPATHVRTCTVQYSTVQYSTVQYSALYSLRYTITHVLTPALGTGGAGGRRVAATVHLPSNTCQYMHII